MVYFVPSVDVLTDAGETKSIPITKELFNPDVHVMNQKIIRYLYPEAAPGFINSIIQSHTISAVKLYPLLYLDVESIITPNNVPIEFALFSKLGSGKSQLQSDKTIEIYANQINNIIEQGWKQVVKPEYQMSQNVKRRTIKLDTKQKSEILIFNISFVALINKKFYVDTFKTNEDNDSVAEAFQKSVIYFQTNSAPEAKLSFKLEIGYFDLETQKFSTTCEYAPSIILSDNIFTRSIVRATQYSPTVFLGNLIKEGMNKIGPKLEKETLVAEKQFKFKG